MSERRYSLRGRIVLTIIGSVIATSLIFGLAAFTIAYTMEDRLFQRALAAEVSHQQLAWARSGQLVAPTNPQITVHRRTATLPPEIRPELAENPDQTEFYGRDGRHYHIRHFNLGPGQSGSEAIVAIEVSKDLLVRPYRDSIIVVLAAISLAIAMVMAGLAWWLANRAMKPLSNLAEDVANAQATIPTLQSRSYPAYEIGTLAAALEQAFARIRGFVAREQAFTRDASHELRTPLAVVRGAAEVIALNRDLPLHLVEPLRRIETATSDMTLALDQLLALARENSGVTTERVVLREMIDKAVAWSQVRHPNHSIAVHNSVDRQVEVEVNPTSLQLVLNNLIGNCFQHVEAGRVTMAFNRGCLTISDDGPGMVVDGDPYAPFVRSSSSIGSGLGLDITRRLCEAAKIGLAAGRGEDGSGTYFCLKLRVL